MNERCARRALERGQTYHAYALGTAEASDLGRLFYIDGFGRLSYMDWVKADNMEECPYTWPPAYGIFKNSNGDKDEPDEEQVKPEVLVYPNPSRESFTIKMTNLKDHDFFTLKVSDLSARIIYEHRHELPLNSDSYEFIWEPDKLNDGFFIYHITFYSYRSGILTRRLS